MRTRQLVPVLALIFGAAAALGACDDDTTPTLDAGAGGTGGTSADASVAGSGGAGGTAGMGGTGGTAGTGGTGGTAGAGGAGGTAGTGTGGMGGRPSLAMCGEAGNTCTQAQMNDYNNCLVSKCETAYRPCIGDNWQSGQYGGACGTWFMCVNACGCNNTSCVLACGFPPAACQTCLTTAGMCQTTMCPQPACYSTRADGGTTTPGFDGGLPPGGGCDDLKKCCDSITNAELKMNCNAAVSAGMPGLCSQALSGFRAAMICM